MTTETVVQESEEQQMFGGEDTGKTINPSAYGCQILKEKTTLEQAKDKTLPNDARLVRYVFNEVEYLDVTRGRKIVDIFDMYYDTYGKDAVKSIDFGYGTVRPNLWGYKQKDGKKKK
tara:strand:- start:578 stop:928 length:351 start_codon:yes stop_codon:yes gene_type:complete